MRLLKIATLVALVTSASALIAPGRRDIQSGRSLQTRDEKPPSKDVKPVLDKSLKDLKPKIDEAMEKLKPAIEKGVKGMKHPEDLKAVKPKVQQVLKGLQPEFEKAIKDTRPPGQVLKDLKPKVDNAFKGLRPELTKVWNDMKTGLDKAFDELDIDITTAALFPFLLFAAIFQDHQ